MKVARPAVRLENSIPECLFELSWVYLSHSLQTGQASYRIPCSTNSTSLKLTSSKELGGCQWYRHKMREARFLRIDRVSHFMPGPAGPVEMGNDLSYFGSNQEGLGFARSVINE